MIEKRSRLNDLDPSLEKRIAAEDRPYRVVGSTTYDLPFGKGKTYLANANRLANLVVGGWNVNLIYTLQPGTPLNWGNVIYLGGPLNLAPHNVDGAFAVSQFNRVSAQQLASNSTNRVIFNAPDLSPISSTFGKILGQANTPRRIQMALRFVF